MPQVTIKLFAMVKERLGRDEIQIEVPGPITARQLLQMVKVEHAAIAGLIDSCRVASDHQFCMAGDLVNPDSEIALIPPVSGGVDVPRSHVVLTREPILHDDFTPLIADPAAGAHAIFTGVVRDNHQGRDVDSIQYEAYEDMARAQLEVVARELLLADEDVCRVVLVHTLLCRPHHWSGSDSRWC